MFSRVNKSTVLSKISFFLCKLKLIEGLGYITKNLPHVLNLFFLSFNNNLIHPLILVSHEAHIGYYLFILSKKSDKNQTHCAAHTDEQRRVKSTPSSSSFTFCNRIWYQIRNFTECRERTVCTALIHLKQYTYALYSLRCRSLPKRLCSRAMVLQFHRWFLNWCWHSPIQFLIPAPIACITLGCWRHNWRCLLINPGMLSHITCDPRVPMYLHKRWKHREWAMGIS